MVSISEEGEMQQWSQQVLPDTPICWWGGGRKGRCNNGVNYSLTQHVDGMVRANYSGRHAIVLNKTAQSGLKLHQWYAPVRACSGRFGGGDGQALRILTQSPPWVMVGCQNPPHSPWFTPTSVQKSELEFPRVFQESILLLHKVMSESQGCRNLIRIPIRGLIAMILKWVSRIELVPILRYSRVSSFYLFYSKVKTV